MADSENRSDGCGKGLIIVDRSGFGSRWTCILIPPETKNAQVPNHRRDVYKGYSSGTASYQTALGQAGTGGKIFDGAASTGLLLMFLPYPSINS